MQKLFNTEIKLLKSDLKLLCRHNPSVFNIECPLVSTFLEYIGKKNSEGKCALYYLLTSEWAHDIDFSSSNFK